MERGIYLQNQTFNCFISYFLTILIPPSTAAATDLISQMTCSEKYLQNPLYARSHFQYFLGGPENGTPTAHDRNIVSQCNHLSSP